ncbi:MAG TPA: sigma-54 dependent transcriptional regulator [Spirochaetota bacterium]|nr:sigma-54 dependent transcriptional regulator [Spirochaetota bacterium]HOS56358.1 sigma-54 dependent transcriptional regulator [Spirochaetota bacterium]HPK61121.1 sigma-54 dependent transcriptional regulator [Spirochaetota bacterium]HQF77544.1 sigma-54 dependent transcriptional regulator [Spirochaetota bacterium]HQH29756.1 sigma-54 dependent transcriptional regulator [Spirochaetota bacterium]
MNEVSICVVDDETDLLISISEYFPEYKIETFSSPEVLLNILEKKSFDIIISDFKMPKMSGLELLRSAKKINAFKYGILLTAYADKNILEKTINDGLAKKIIEKPVLMKELKPIIDEAIEYCRELGKKESEISTIKNNYINLKKETQIDINNIIGADFGLKEVFNKVRSIAKHPVSVLLTGETGTGKELIARAIHELSPRRDYPFIKINTTAIPDTLFESELFGYKKGAFSSATSDKPGKIELADKGTLFLDEIGDMSFNLQAKLLRAIQEKEIERLGSNNIIKVDFRLIAATNRDLTDKIKNNAFREDLFYRINEFPISLPSLRSRKDDIPELVKFFIKKFSEELKIKNVAISKDALNLLKSYDWPGNVRELENAVKRALIVAGNGAILLPAHFNFIFPVSSESELSVDRALTVIKDNIINKNLDFHSLEESVILKILRHFNGNVSEAVEKTGLSKNRFYKFKS